MGIIEDIEKMQQEGKSDQDITILLQESGYGIREINDALSQAKIKQAVAENMQDPAMTTSFQGQDHGLKQSIMNQPMPNEQVKNQNAGNNYAQAQSAQLQEQYQQIPQQEFPQQAYTQQPASYDTYQQYNSDYDTVTEIAEQVVAEKISALKNKIESILDMKNSVDSRIASLAERISRIEKIMDRLQLSILQKVGEYVANVEDIKKEMVETQKSFKSLLSKK